MANKFLVQGIYDTEISNVMGSPEKWKDVLALAGQLYRYEFDNIILVYAQRPHATLIADYDTWKKVDRYVKRGSKGIAIFPSRALNPRMRYVFDISDTGGKNVKLTWSLEGNGLNDYLDYLEKNGQISDYDHSDRKQQLNLLKDFTESRISVIIEEEFGEKMTELMQLSGSVIKEFSEKREGLQQFDMEGLVKTSILYAVGTRCGFDLSMQEQDFGQIGNITDEEMIYRLGSLVCDVSCSVLREFNHNIRTIERERRNAYGRTNDLQRSGRDSVSGDPVAGESGRGTEGTGQVRKNGNEVSEGERAGQVQDPHAIRETGTEDERSGRGSEYASGSVDGELSEKAQAARSEFDHGNVEVERTGEDGGGGSSPSPDRAEIPLEEDEELNRELDELNSLGKTEEVSQYVQASFFDADYGLELSPSLPMHTVKKSGNTFEYNGQKYTYIAPKKEPVVPEEYVKQTVLRGTGFVEGKTRVCKIFETEIDAATRAKLIKKEYGQGGAGWPLDGYGLHGYDTFHGQGIRFQWRDAEGEKEGYVSWKNIENTIAALILTGEYQPDQKRLVEQSFDEGQEVEEVIEGTYREIEEEELDDYAIPDEPDGYARNRLTEDELVTIAEYGDEIEAEYDIDETPHPIPLSVETDHNKKLNYHYNLWELEKGGAKTRYQWNVDAIRLLKQIESEGRLATAVEQKILSKYVGWGGLSQAFYENNTGWEKEYKELKSILTEEEYTDARATVNNAFYTAPEVAMCINQALVKFGFRGGNVLEPSMGIGNFFGCIPTPMQKSNLYGVEIDSISGRIAKQLYQNAKISITGFENTDYPDNFFDVVIGNVPFGDYKLHDPKYNKYNFRIHDYFLAKSLDVVRPGGMVAVITTKGTLDKSNPAIRKYLAERAELVGAIRLPNTAFKDNAGTEVTADILFLQKRERKVEIEPEWVHLGYTDNGIAVNSYFVEHPEMILGRMEYDTRIFGRDSRYTVCVNDDENFNLYEAVTQAVSHIEAQMTDFESVLEEEEHDEEVIPADPDVRNFTYTFFDGKLYFRENSVMARKSVSQTAEERIRRLDEIRQITRELINIQLEGSTEEEIADKQRLLNEKYDQFVKQYGYITGKANRTAFRDDSDYPLLCSLEEVNEEV